MCHLSYDQATIAQLSAKCSSLQMLLWLGNQPVAVASEEVSHCLSELK